MIIRIDRQLAAKASGFCFLLLFFSGISRAAEDPVALFEAGKYEEAKKGFLDKQKKAPDDPVVMYYLGRLISDGVGSRRLFEQLLQKHPNHDLADDALFELAESDFAHPAGTYLTARKRYRQLLKMFPASPHIAMAHYRIGLTFLVVHQPDSAIVAFDSAMMGSEYQVKQQARLGRLEALVLKGQKEEAVQAAGVWIVEGAGDVVLELQAFIDRFPPTPSHEAKTEGKFWVRVGAFGHIRNVTVIKKKLEDAKFRVSLIKRVGSKLTLVDTGPYTERKDAEADRKRIAELTGLSCEILVK